MQSSLGPPPCVGGAANGELAIGACPGKEACAGALPNAPDGGAALPKAPGGGAEPLTGGKAGSFAVPALPGSGAGNAPCAQTCPAWNVTTATRNGAINRRIIKAVPSGPASLFPTGERLQAGILRLLPRVNNPWNWARARRDVAPDRQ